MASQNPANCADHMGVHNSVTISAQNSGLKSGGCPRTMRQLEPENRGATVMRMWNDAGCLMTSNDATSTFGGHSATL